MYIHCFFTSTFLKKKKKKKRRHISWLGHSICNWFIQFYMNPTDLSHIFLHIWMVIFLSPPSCGYQWGIPSFAHLGPTSYFYLLIMLSNDVEFFFFFFLFYLQKNVGRNWLLSPPVSEQTYNFKPEGLTCGTQLPAAIGIDLCTKLQIAHRQKLLTTKLEHWWNYIQYKDLTNWTNSHQVHVELLYLSLCHSQPTPFFQFYRFLGHLKFP